VESVQFTTTDGITLSGDFALPTTTGGTPCGGIVICHPHPLYGGNRMNPMVTALFESLPARGFAALRFDFRAEHDHGNAEQLDIIAALDVLAGLTDAPLMLVGYSFGAIVALNTTDERITTTVAIAPPLSAMTVSPPNVRSLVLTPRHDQFTPPEVAEPIVADWPHTDVEVIEFADHFLAGATVRIAERVGAWLSDPADSPGDSSGE
jgi:alpha/beta superfamily hydrolase